MLLLRRPSRRVIDRFLADARQMPLSYGPIGLARGGSVDRHVDETVVVIGRGRAAFDRAKSALAQWQQFRLGWVELFPPNASLEAGTVVAVLVHHLQCWSLNGCRIVYGVGESHDDERFGFAYGTLTNHAESGEELFEVVRNPESDDVVYRIRAVSRPYTLLAQLGYPYTRSLQARFRRDSVAAMRRATGRDA